MVHRLVAQTFLPNPCELPEINHKDCCGSNNAVDNLEWCDRKYNINYADRTAKAAEACEKKVESKSSHFVTPSERQQDQTVLN